MKNAPKQGVRQLELASLPGHPQEQGVCRYRIGLGADRSERERDALAGTGLRRAPMHDMGLGDAAELALEIVHPAERRRWADAG